MNENIDLTKILKDCPKYTKLYSSIYGEVLFEGIITGKCNHFIEVYVKALNSLIMFTYSGRYFLNGECVLFPSKDQRDWNKFTAPWYKKEKFDPKTLKPFNKVLVRDSDVDVWQCEMFSHFCSRETTYPFFCCGSPYYYCIPYNSETEHLLGTTEEAPQYYRYWED